MKRLCADDSADSRVKVGHRQANIYSKGPLVGPFVFSEPENLEPIKSALGLRCKAELLLSYRRYSSPSIAAVYFDQQVLSGLDADLKQLCNIAHVVWNGWVVPSFGAVPGYTRGQLHCQRLG